jgi:hypothetical protein
MTERLLYYYLPTIATYILATYNLIIADEICKSFKRIKYCLHFGWKTWREWKDRKSIKCIQTEIYRHILFSFSFFYWQICERATTEAIDKVRRNNFNRSSRRSGFTRSVILFSNKTSQGMCSPNITLMKRNNGARGHHKLIYCQKQKFHNALDFGWNFLFYTKKTKFLLFFNNESKLILLCNGDVSGFLFHFTEISLLALFPEFSSRN